MSATGHNLRRRLRAQRAKQQAAAEEPLPEADSTEKESPGEEMTEAGEASLTATHRGGGYYRVTNADGETVAESVTKDEAREMGAEV